jgi:hypothetical protein
MKISFVISHKFYRGYESYLCYYIENIKKFYNDALIIVVDNNSTHKEDIINKLKIFNSVIFLENNITCKYELGAYQVGIKYLIDNNLEESYDYFVFSQDTFILKNKYDFNILLNNNITACSIVTCKNDWAYMEQHGSPILKKLNLNNKLEQSRLCWCNSFIISNSKIKSLFDYLQNIIIITRKQSEASERYMGRILLELNNGKSFDIDGEIDKLSYYCHTVNPYETIANFFCKKAQQKNEYTKKVEIS